MENELNKDNIKLTHCLNEIGHWSELTETIKFNWEYVTKVQILSLNYCLLTFGNNEQFTLYKYINL